MSTLEPPTDPPRHGLSKLRRSRKDGDKTDKNSSTSSLVPVQDDSNGGLRASIDGALVKLKDRSRKSSDARERRASIDSISHSRLAKLPLVKKSRKKTSADEHSSSPATDEHVKSDRRLSQTPSELSLGREGSGHSSLLTEDSDYDE